MSSRPTSLRPAGLTLLHPEVRFAADPSSTVEAFRFSTDAYLGLVDRGLIGSEQRIELIDGLVIDMAPIGESHQFCADMTLLAMVRAVGHQARVAANLTLVLGDGSAPQPDIALLPPRFLRAGAGHARGSDTLLVIEVSDASLTFDRVVKRRLYSAHGVREFWIINVRDQLLEVYREPAEGGYSSFERLDLLASVSPLAFPDARFEVAAFFRGPDPFNP